MATEFPRDWDATLALLSSLTEQCGNSARKAPGENFISNDVIGFYINNRGQHFELSTSIFMSGRIVGLTIINPDNTIDTDDSFMVHTVEELTEFLEAA